MSGSVIIEIPGPPRGKGRPRFTTNGWAYTDAKTRAYERELAMHAKAAMRGRAPMEGPLELHVTAHMPIPTSWSVKKKEQAKWAVIRPTIKPDSDNILKVIDAFNGIVWVDDAQIVEASVVKLYASAEPFLAVMVLPAVMPPDTPSDWGRTGN